MKVEAMTETIMTSKCLACHQELDQCKCVWAAIRDMQKSFETHRGFIIKKLADHKIGYEDRLDKLQKRLDQACEFWCDELNKRFKKIEKKINCENISRGHGFDLKGGECISCFTVQVKSEQLIKQEVDEIEKYCDEMQEHVNAAFWYNQADLLKTKVQHMEMQLGKEKEDYKHLLSLFDDLKQNYEILKATHSRLISASPRNERLIRAWEQEESNNHNGGCCL